MIYCILSISPLSNVNLSVSTQLFQFLNLFNYLFQMFNNLIQWRHVDIWTWGHEVILWFHWLHCWYCFHWFHCSIYFIIVNKLKFLTSSFLTNVFHLLHLHFNNLIQCCHGSHGVMGSLCAKLWCDFIDFMIFMFFFIHSFH